MAFKLGREEIQFINAFDESARVSAKACFVDKQTVVFFVEERDIGKAIGRNGSNIKKFKDKINKNVEILPFSNQAEKLMAKVLKMMGIKVEAIAVKEENNRKIIFLNLDSEGKQKLLRSKSRLKRLRAILKKNFEIENIKLR